MKVYYGFSTKWGTYMGIFKDPEVPRTRWFYGLVDIYFKETLMPDDGRKLPEN